jgi:6-phosphofructokinase 1
MPLAKWLKEKLQEMSRAVTMTPITRRQLQIDCLGAAIHPSPLRAREPIFREDDRVLVNDSTADLVSLLRADEEPPSFERAGPRSLLFFPPELTSCAIVTCGGLCPGENDVIRSIVLTLAHCYGVRRILGIRYGYAGLSAHPPEPHLELTPESVENLHAQGGTVLASSRGAQDVAEMVDTLVRQRIDVLFTIGGDGTARGASALADEIERRKLPIAVVGVPKTIDDDLDWIDCSFGSSTAVDEARRAIGGAHVEAKGAWNGIGLVKLMGRHSGFIAAHACLSNPHVNFCWIPEVPMRLEGPEGLLLALDRRLTARHHAVLVVAEEALQDILPPDEPRRDASGNLRLVDVGVYLREAIERHFDATSQEVNVKYFDPSYLLRSCPANGFDAGLRLRLGQHAVHAAMAGRTRLLVGFWHGRFVHVPLGLVTAQRRYVDPAGPLWQSVLESTGQHLHCVAQQPQ